MTLSDADLAYMRDSIGELLPAKCNILSLTQTSDSQGGYTHAWGTASTFIDCRLDYKRGDEQVFGDSQNPYHGFVITLPVGTTVTIASRVEIGSTQYNISAIDTGKSWNASIRCAVEAV